MADERALHVRDTGIESYLWSNDSDEPELRVAALVSPSIPWPRERVTSKIGSVKDLNAFKVLGTRVVIASTVAIVNLLYSTVGSGPYDARHRSGPKCRCRWPKFALRKRETYDGIVDTSLIEQLQHNRPSTLFSGCVSAIGHSMILSICERRYEK